MMKQFFKENKWLKSMIIAGLAIICLYLSLLYFKECELFLQYQYYWFTIGTSSFRISAIHIRLFVLLFFILVWGATWFITRKVFHKKVLCPLFIVTCLLCALGTNLLNLYGGKWARRHTHIESAFSEYEGDYVGDINVKIEGDTIVISHSENEGLSYFDYQQWEEIPFEDLELTVTFYRDDTVDEIASGMAVYISEVDSYCIRIPEIMDEFQCGLLTVRAGGYYGGLFTGICLGSLKTSWYQWFLKTDLLLENLLDEDEFCEAITEGKIGAGRIARMIWRCFIFVTEEWNCYVILAINIYLTFCLYITYAVFENWKAEKERRERLRRRDIRDKALAMMVMQANLISQEVDSEADDSDLDTRIKGRKNTEEKGNSVQEYES